MTRDELKKLIADDEGETVEVKETTGQRVDACETLCAFLNKDGGTVVFGVTKNGKLTGQLVSDKAGPLTVVVYKTQVWYQKMPGEAPRGGE